jgi:hypothetical protein
MTPHVYFCRFINRPLCMPPSTSIKIGFTCIGQRRIQQHRVGRPSLTVNFLFACPGSRRLEQNFHKVFEHRRIGGRMTEEFALGDYELSRIQDELASIFGDRLVLREEGLTDA